MSVEEALSGIVYLIPLILFSILGFWKGNSLAFILAAATSTILGFSSDASTNLGLGIGILLWGYGVVCFGLAFGCMFNKSEAPQ